MSTSLADQLFQQLRGAPLQQVAQQLGANPAQTSDAIGAALPLLLGALGKNASQPAGAQALLGALQNDHAGSGLDIGSVLGAVLGGGAQSRQTNGAGILGHVLGGNQQHAAASLGQATGLGGDKANMLLQILAPIVMSFVAKQFLGGGQQASASGLGQLLGLEQQAAQQQGGLAGGLLGAVLDQDGDGQLGIGDLLKIGGGLLGGKS
ncbi:MAG: DUF937 domain-containing protein [Pseudoxanthomonas sp.]